MVLDTEAALSAGDLKIPLDRQIISIGDTVIGTVGFLLNAIDRGTDEPTALADTGLLDEFAKLNDITVFKSVGTAAQDIFTAQLVYEQSLEKGLGFLFDLTE